MHLVMIHFKISSILPFLNVAFFIGSVGIVHFYLNVWYTMKIIMEFKKSSKVCLLNVSGI